MHSLCMIPYLTPRCSGGATNCSMWRRVSTLSPLASARATTGKVMLRLCSGPSHPHILSYAALPCHIIPYLITASRLYPLGDYLMPPARKNTPLKQVCSMANAISDTRMLLLTLCHPLQAIHRVGGDPNEVILFASVVKRILPET